jgi:pimeloyl-ACP methyl ester carboxylesterase
MIRSKNNKQRGGSRRNKRIGNVYVPLLLSLSLSSILEKNVVSCFTTKPRTGTRTASTPTSTFTSIKKGQKLSKVLHVSTLENILDFVPSRSKKGIQSNIAKNSNLSPFLASVTKFFQKSNFGITNNAHAIDNDTDTTSASATTSTAKRATATATATVGATTLEENKPLATLNWPIASGQEQLHWMTRIGKAIHEESIPYLASIIITLIPALIIRSTTPITISILADTLFCIYCTAKVIFKLNKPILPEPILRSNWEDLADLVWSSQRDLQSNRNFLMGWYYDKPFESLREEDALAYLAWMKHGVSIEHRDSNNGMMMISNDQYSTLKTYDYPLLCKKVNHNKPLPKRKENENPLPVMRFNCEPLRYRHKPLLFYGVTHGINFVLHQILRGSDFTYVPAKDTKKDLGYWYRLPEDVTSTKKKKKNEKTTITDMDNMDMTIHPPLVFAHGVGGLAFCYKLIDDLLHDNAVKEQTPIILLDLPHVSLRIHDDIPEIKHQVKSMTKIIDDVVSLSHGERKATATATGSVEKGRSNSSSNSPNKATFVGHSFGTILLSWMVQSNPERVGGCVFLDPVCFNLHLKDILFNFHMQRVDKKKQAGKEWNNPFDLASLIDLAGTEMHTNTAMLRQFSWASNSLWPEDLKKNNIPATIVLAENDEIVPSSAVEELFSDFNSKNRKTDHSPDVSVFKNACHGEMFMGESMREDTANMILNVMEKSRKSALFTNPISLIKKEYQALIDDTAGEFWDQISYHILPRAVGEREQKQTSPIRKAL